jgi:hypothetical protein
LCTRKKTLLTFIKEKWLCDHFLLWKLTVSRWQEVKTPCLLQLFSIHRGLSSSIPSNWYIPYVASKSQKDTSLSYSINYLYKSLPIPFETDMILRSMLEAILEFTKLNQFYFSILTQKKKNPTTRSVWILWSVPDNPSTGFPVPATAGWVFLSCTTGWVSCPYNRLDLRI